MSETPLIDELNELGPAGLRLLNACRDVVDQAEAELRALKLSLRGRGRPPADRIGDARELLVLLEREPAVSANQAAERLHMRRQFVYAMLRAVRPSSAPRKNIPEWRSYVLERAGHACEICGRASSVLQAHHIDGDRDNADYSNGACLCASCHRSVHSRQELRDGVVLLSRTADDVLAFEPSLAYLLVFPMLLPGQFPKSEVA